MFAFFKRDWVQSTPWKWAGLFLFEFIVVLLGVLVAQMLQERFEQRREAERFKITQEVLNDQMQMAATSLMIRGLQAQCIRDNLQAIREAAQTGSSTDLSGIVGHPQHPAASMGVWSSEVARDARRYLEPELVNSYDYVATLAKDITELRRQEEEWWASILLASEGADRLTAQERSAVVLASYKLEHAFEGWDRSIPSFVGRLAKLGLAPDVDIAERIHQGDGVCAKEVRETIPSLRNYVAEVMAEQ